VEQQTTILQTVLFVSMPHQHFEVDSPLFTISTTSSEQQPPQEDSLITDHLPAMCLNVQPAAIKTAHSFTAVNSVVPSTAPAKGSLAQ